MRKFLIAGAAAVVSMAAVPASAQALLSADPGLQQGSIVLVGSKNEADKTGGYDYGPMGQCFDPAVCGRGRGAYRGGRGALAFDNEWQSDRRAHRNARPRHQPAQHMEMTR
jgi:hypothetical protein